MTRIFAVLLLAQLLAQPASSQKASADSIDWSPAYRLTWADFRAEPVKNSETVAMTNTSLGVDFHLVNNKLDYAIRCRFTRSKSWGYVKTDYVLRHEQGHFDITEVFARKLNKRLGEYVFDSRTFKTDLDKIYSDIVAEKTAMQEQYDRETDHSRIREKQEEWLQKIGSMLREYEAYSDYH
jgi:hypothetical protein